MKPAFSHLIVTRFNINFNDLYKTKYGDTVRTDHWLQHRYLLFEEWCFPSVKGQKNQNFTWLVFFDIATPVIFKQKINDLAISYPNFHPVYISSAQEFANTLKLYVNSNIISHYTITSRVDNDDMLHSEYVDHVQNLFKPGNYLIDSPYGYQLTIEDKKPLMVKSFNKYSPFISLVERTKNFQSVYSKEHQKWKGHIKRLVLNKPGWVQVIHGKNVSNRFHSKNNYLMPFTLLADFNVSPQVIESFNFIDNKMIVSHNTKVPFYKALDLAKRLIKMARRLVISN